MIFNIHSKHQNEHLRHHQKYEAEARFLLETQNFRLTLISQS